MKARAEQPGSRRACLKILRGFTLLEIMMVVAIMGLIVAVGMPSFVTSIRKDGMRKAISDVQDACRHARERAILTGATTSVTFRPVDRTFTVDGGAGPNQASGGTLPDGVDVQLLYINLDDFTQSDWGKVFFHPNGTCDEMTIVLHGGNEYKKITLEYSTALTVLSDVDQ